MRNMLVVCLLLFASTAIAATDLVATYKYPDGNAVTIVTRDSQHVRMDTSATSYLLLQENTVYSVSQDESGQWMVMDMGQMKAMTSGGVMSLFGGGKTAPSKEQEYSAKYEKTDQKEKIAGYTGVVYNVTVMDGETVVRQDEVVLSSHADLKKVNEGWSAIGAKMSDVMGDEMAKSVEKATKEAKTAGYGGMLRYGNEMRLESLKKMSLDLSYYKVPANAQSVNMGQMPNFQSQQQMTGTQEPQKKTPQQQSKAAQVIEQDAADVGQAAKQEAKDATVDEVRDGVRTLFKSLFD